MPPILLVGIVVFTGLLSGEVLKRLGLPKVTGYILGGVLLNPGLFGIVPAASSAGVGAQVPPISSNTPT